MSPRRIIATAVASAVAAGGVTAAVVATDDNDDPVRTVTITGAADDSIRIDDTGIERAVTRALDRDTTSLDDVIARGEKLSFDLRGTSSALRGRVARDADGRITGRIVARP